MYTYIKQRGNTIFTSKYVNGKKTYERDNNFKPYLFLRTTNKDAKYKSFPDYFPLEKLDFNSIKSYSENVGLYDKNHVFGNVSREIIPIQKIRREKLNENIDMSLLDVWMWDIEVFSPDRFPKPNEAQAPVTSIALVQRKTFKTKIWMLTEEFSTLKWFQARYPAFSSFSSFEEIKPILTETKNQWLTYWKDMKENEENKIESIFKSYRTKLASGEITDEPYTYEDEKDIIGIENENYVSIDDIVEPFEKLVTEYEFEYRHWHRVERVFQQAMEMDVYKFQDEYELLTHFTQWVGKSKIDVLCGYNSETFDTPYIINRCKNIGVDVKKLSPFGIIGRKEVETYGNELISSGEIFGIVMSDYLQLDKNYTQNKRDSYKLADMAYAVTGEKKVSHEGTVAEMWIRDKQEHGLYNIHDSELLCYIDDSLGYIDTMFGEMYDAGVTQKAYTSISNIISASLWNELLDDNLVIPSQNTNFDTRSINLSEWRMKVRLKKELSKWLLELLISNHTRQEVK